MGFVFKDKRSGRVVWSVAFHDVNGRLRRERTKAANKMLARRILSERENAVERAKLQGYRSAADILTPSPAVTLREFSDEYMQHSTANKTPASADRDRIALKHLLRYFGAATLREISPGEVQKYSDSRLRQTGRFGKVKPRTVHVELSTLSAIFREAMKRELVDRNPVRGIVKPRPESEIVRYLDRDEERRLLAAAPEWLRAIIVAAIHSGLRESELAGLTWADVKFEEKAVIVRNTKSHRDRAVPMSETLHRTLAGLPRHIRSPYVFTNPETQERYERFNNTAWRNTLRRAAIAHLRWHDMRHTFASRLAQAGVPLKVIQELLGHSSVTVTMRYAHMAPDNRRDAVRVLDGPEAASITTHGTTHQAVSGAGALEKSAGNRKLLNVR